LLLHLLLLLLHLLLHLLLSLLHCCEGLLPVWNLVSASISISDSTEGSADVSILVEIFVVCHFVNQFLETISEATFSSCASSFSNKVEFEQFGFAGILRAWQLGVLISG
jgi:hypothetical protein